MRYLKSSTTATVRLALATAAVALFLAVPAAAQAAWGAIAVDPLSGHYGVSYDYNTAHGAQHRAKVECHTSHCKVAVWVRNGWAALVQKRSNGFYFAGYGHSKHAAFHRAIRRTHEPNPRRVTSVFSGI